MNQTPWHFWIVVTIAFVWHLVGCLDYTAVQYEWRSWMEMMSQRQASYVEGLPDWIDGAWAISVWTGLLGVLLLAGRARFAPAVLFVSFVALGVIATWAAFFSVPDVEDVASPTALWILVLSAILGLLLWLYARAMNRRGVIG